MRHSRRDGLGDGKGPGFRRLVRQPGDEIDADVCNASLSKPLNLFQHEFAVVETSYRLRLTSHEGLHPQTDAVHAALQQRLNQRRSERSRSAFHRDLCTRNEGELASWRAEGTE